MEKLVTQYQLLPDLSAEEYAALRDSIQLDGVKVPVEYDEDENIMDGHHRVRICQELGIKDWPRVVRMSMTEEQKTEHILALNLDRRHLNKEQRQELVAKLREQGWSMRRIADKLRVSIGTTHGDIQVFKNEHLGPNSILGTDGKQYSATRAEPYARPLSLFNPSKMEVQKARAVVESGNADLIERMDDTGNVDRAWRELKRGEQLQELLAKTPAAPSDRWSVEVGDVATWQTDRHFDFIITDPPYPREYLPLYGTLARRAREWLTPGGLLIAMCGQSYLDEIYHAMGEYLCYYWTACYLTPGPATPLRMKQVNSNWKPVLVYAPSDKYTGKTFGDVFHSDANDKDFHKWGQSVSGMLSLISQVCLPGQSILDPFCGGGSTGVAALQHGCTFHGLDIDRESVRIAQARLGEIV
jgi:site-specific DNA-methyltransferase (adenine-specific)